MAEIDASKLEQALENLLSNAIKYTPDEGTITLSLAGDGERAKITVQDTGAGIEPSLLPSLFAKYHRLPGQATRAAGGTGLGLLIAKEIVEGHGGLSAYRRPALRERAHLCDRCTDGDARAVAACRVKSRQ